MIKILIADDEPLVQIGLRSMISWSSLGAEICGTASNGDAAWEMIREHHPDIVITDIQMPCSSGLELGKRCMDELGRLPVFIILTSFEDFEYAREAMSFCAVDYLVKIDLSPDSLTEAVTKAIEQVNLIKQQDPDFQDSRQSLLLFQERFYIRLLNNLFESREQFLHQREEFQIHLDAAGYAAAMMRYIPNAPGMSASEDMGISLRTYNQTVQMFQELLSRYIPCHIVALDTHYLAVIFFLKEEHIADWKKVVSDALESTFQMLRNYYNADFQTSVGSLVNDSLELCSSYSDARQLLSYLSDAQPLLFYDETPDANTLRNIFSLSLFRDDISQAFQELDEHALRNTLDPIIALLAQDHMHFSQALDAAGSILHFSMTLLADGAELVSDIFRNEPDSYHSLYRIKSASGIITWLTRLEEGLCRAFQEKKKGHQHSLAVLCCQYIREHIHERIYLQDIADTFAISPNYLSQLFKKYMHVGISEYITTQKIDESKKLLKETNLKVYEISDHLGFESSFYFSKVFKKITGMSPKDYRNLL
ncbi:MAG TPA: AraC family transcriptional regulator [Candidatus Blautia merdavium]|uniref:Stage 0 sporulation protein A homolog n=1 Tax=Candidatus Blautia merdavium TaxID=2838494 RepID=A0A9D2TAQ5_9FIRM|nr:AraC family transcriptional regulator [Candidatus Blautia merdavium]